MMRVVIGDPENHDIMMIVFIYVAHISEQDQIQDFLDIEVCLRLNPRFLRPSYFGDRIQNFLLDQILKKSETLRDQISCETIE